MPTTLTNTGITFPDGSIQTDSGEMTLGGSVSGVNATSITCPISNGSSFNELLIVVSSANTSGPSENYLRIQDTGGNNFVYQSGVMWRPLVGVSTYQSAGALSSVTSLLGNLYYGAPTIAVARLTKLSDYKYFCNAYWPGVTIQGLTYSQAGLAPSLITFSGTYITGTSILNYYIK